MALSVSQALPAPVGAVLFDRDGTLVVDVPYNNDPELVEPMPGAAALLERVRREGIRTGLVSNQSGIGRGLITPDQLAAVTARVQQQLGPLDVTLACPHRPDEGCACRKPAPGMVLEACRRLGVAPEETVVVGDIGADMGAAAAAGAYAILVPTPVTLREEVEAAPLVARDLAEVEQLLFGARSAPAAGAATSPGGGR